MSTKAQLFTSEIPSESDLEWRLTVPCCAIACSSIEEAEQALAALASLDDYCAGAIITVDGYDTAIAYLGNSFPDWPDVTRFWLSGRRAHSLGLPNPLRRE